MQKLKVRAHAPFIGSTGFNKHAQHFFTQLSRLTPVEVRNFSVGDSWKDLSDEPHNGEPYMTAEIKSLLTSQIMLVS